MRRIALILTLLVFPLLSVSAATHSAAEPGAVRASDAEIQQKISAKLAKSKIGKDGLVAHVRGGVVTWEGHTAVPQHKGAATRMAKSSGAVRVVNNIQVTDGAQPGKPIRKAKVE